MKLFNLFYRVSSVLAIVLVIAGAPALLSAQQQSFQVNPDHSTASFYLGSPESPTSFNLGLARVSGEVEVKPDDVSASQFNFTIHAANQNAAAGSDSQNVSGDQPVISFQSEDVKQRDDGTLEVHGKLTVTQVYREAVTGTGEDYSGRVYGPATRFRTSREATFIFAAPKGAAPASNSGDARELPAQLNQSESEMVLAATATVNGEAFPELALSIQEVAWPMVVDDEQCVTPLTVGEDYSGATCTGTAHEPSASPVVLVQPGEDYAGIQQLPPVGDQVTIQLKLRLANADHSAALDGTGNSQQQVGTR